MTCTGLSHTQLVSAVKELAAASSLDILQDVLTRYPHLPCAGTDGELTRAIQAGLEHEALDKISVLFMVRGFLALLKGGKSLEAAVDGVGGLPFYQVDPIAQIGLNAHPTPYQAKHQIHLCRQALRLVRRDTEPSLWAYLHFTLADHLKLIGHDQPASINDHPGRYSVSTNRVMRDGTPSNIEEALKDYQVAADVWAGCGELEQAAQARYRLARLLIDFTDGERRAAALRRAVKLLESTTDVWTCDTHPQEWGNVQAALGLALENLPGGLDADTLEQAIEHYKAAIRAPISPSSPLPFFEKARRAYHLAILLLQRYQPDRAEYIEWAVELLEAALTVRARDVYPEEWADTRNSLANAFQQRQYGDRAHNTEQAIVAYQDALQVWTNDQNPSRWAMIQYNLAEAYRKRILGRSDKNEKVAICHYNEALTVYTRQNHPAQWGSIHNSLATIYCRRHQGNRVQNIKTGIECYEQALEVFTREDYPRQWSQTLNNLANAYCELADGNDTHYLNKAIELYEQALEVRTREAYPRQWGATHNNIGTAYADSGQWKQAIEHFEMALEVRTVEVLPDKALQTGRNLGSVHLRRGAWSEAIKVYQDAREASAILYFEAITEAGKRAEIGRGQGVAPQMAYALAQECALDKAVLVLEQGRARLLAEALARGRAALDKADDRQRNKYEEVVAEIRVLENELRAAELHAQGAINAPTTARSFVEIADDLTSVREILNQVVEAIRQRPGYEDLLAEPDFNDVITAVQSDMPLVYLVATPAGGLALVAHHDGIEHIPLRSLTDKALLAPVRRWFEAYFTHLEARQARAKAERDKTADLERTRSAEESTRRMWNDILVATTRWLWNAVMESIVTTLSGLGYQQATLIPTGFLAFLPLHAAWRPGDKGAPPRYALDDVAFAYAPSAIALTYARQVADDVSGDKLFAVNNPDGSLHYAAQEVSAMIGHFEEPRQVAGYKATRNTVLRALPKYDVYHFACHGNNDWQSPLQSALWMYGKLPLTVSDLLDLKEGAQVRLAFLSACETGLIGTELPDEVVGLATGFVQAGAAGVVSTLWSVDDESTASLAGRFYENWKVGNMSPLEALMNAQHWLRDDSGRDQWKHPHHWAAFTMTGV